MLARVSLVLIRMIQSFKSSVRVLALIRASSALLLVVVLTLLCRVVESVRRAAIVKRLVSIDAVIPIVVLRFVCAISCLIAVHVEYYRVDGL